MQNDQIYSNFLNLIKTREDFNTIKSQLALLIDSLYEIKEGNFDNTLKNKVRADLAKLITEAIQTEPRESVLQKMREELLKVKFLELTLAKEPTENTLEKIFAFINKSINENVALDIKIDPNILSGAYVSFEGKFFDGSIRKRVSEALKGYIKE